VESGRFLLPLSLRLLLGVDLSFYFRVRHCYEALHKIRKFAEFTRIILGGRVWASWLWWHVETFRNEGISTCVKSQPLSVVKKVGIVLFVYGDESMDETKQRVCAVAGIIGREDQWKALEWKWTQRTNGIPFHANYCDSDHGDYANRPHWENKALYRDLTVLLAESGLAGYGQAIDLIAKNKVFPESADITYYTAFQRVVFAMKNFAMHAGDIAELTFDMRLESAHNAGFIYGSLRENEPDWTPHLASKISFEFAKESTRIQVSDLLARETMKALDNQVGPVKRPIRKSWEALYLTDRFQIDAFSTEWFEDLKRKIPEHERTLGMNRELYVEWLRQRNRQHNITTMFQFVDWTARREKEAKKV
jgi:hypothetical protein